MTKKSNESKKPQSDSNTFDNNFTKQESNNAQFQNKHEAEIAELVQQKMMLNAINASLLQKLKIKNYLVIVLAVFTVFSFFTGIYFSPNMDEFEKYRVPNESISSQFVIQNLKGDVIDTWISWRVIEEDLFHIHVINSEYATTERLAAIIDVIMSTEKINLDDFLLNKGPIGESSTYYLGWRGGLNSITEPTKYHIPKNLHFHVPDNNEGDILIVLTNLTNPDGYSGFTRAIVDEAEHQILKSTITIYNIENISIEELKTIVRHELGHGFGLGHSTAPEDLMAPKITTEYPYISECDLDAITLLYNGGESSQVVCEK